MNSTESTNAERSVLNRNDAIHVANENDSEIRFRFREFVSGCRSKVMESLSAGPDFSPVSC